VGSSWEDNIWKKGGLFRLGSWWRWKSKRSTLVRKASEKEAIALSLYIKQLILFVNLLLYDAKLSMV
jgi:hypothetical protein